MEASDAYQTVSFSSKTQGAAHFLTTLYCILVLRNVWTQLERVYVCTLLPACPLQSIKASLDACIPLNIVSWTSGLLSVLCLVQSLRPSLITKQ